MTSTAVRIEAVGHNFREVTAIEHVTLDIEEGEFLTLLGPSGCGKTTLLRIIAGFEQPTAGKVLISGEDVTRLPAHKRPTNMVFQRPTLFPHLDVFENVSFGLRVSKAPREERESRVREALALVRLEGYERRRSHEMSGGQMQRIALARALVNRPKVLLLDEPLSALDMKIRLDMEVELRRVHRETGATFVYVTHDQREAMALSDRLVVMNGGRVEQVGAPTDVYRRPASPFAAQFVGNANVLPVDVGAVDGADAQVRVGSHGRQVRCEAAAPGPAWLVLRPEAVRVTPAAGADGDALLGTIRDVAFRGTGFSCRIELKELGTMLKAEAAAAVAPLVGDTVAVDWDPQACWLLTRSEEAATLPAAPPEAPATADTGGRT